MNILLGVTGGIAVYKSCDVVSSLKRNGCNVRVIMTDAAQEFVRPLTFSTLSENPVMTSLWSENGTIDHIEVAKWCDVFVIAPATHNTIAKLSCGFADNLLTTVYAAIPSDTPKLIFPAMNSVMLDSPPMKIAFEILGSSHPGTFVMETSEKRLACGDYGKGALLPVKLIVDTVLKFAESVKD